jgi:hypothetical protein
MTIMNSIEVHRDLTGVRITGARYGVWPYCLPV